MMESLGKLASKRGGLEESWRRAELGEIVDAVLRFDGHEERIGDGSRSVMERPEVSKKEESGRRMFGGRSIYYQSKGERILTQYDHMLSYTRT